LCYDINGSLKGSSITSGSSTKVAGGWYLINLIIHGSDIIAGNTLNVYAINNDASVQAYIDDMRFQPLNAQTTAYVYDPFTGELTDVLDNNNLYTRYEYNNGGQLIRTYREKLGIGEFKTNEVLSHYQNTYYNDPAVFVGRKNNCSSGIGSMMTVNIPAGAYMSTTSVADANEGANFTYAQQYANQHGVCINNTVPVINSISVSGYALTINWDPSRGASPTILGVSATNSVTNVTTNASISNNYNFSQETITVPGPGNYSVTVNDVDYSNPFGTGTVTVTSAPYIVNVY
jgi:hypothetical protein